MLVFVFFFYYIFNCKFKYNVIVNNLGFMLVIFKIFSLYFSIIYYNKSLDGNLHKLLSICWRIFEKKFEV